MGQGLPDEIDRGQYIVDLPAAVINSIIKFLAISGTAPVFGSHDYVSLFNSFPDKWSVVLGIEIAVDTAVHPYQGSVSPWTPLLEWLEYVDRYFQSADPALIRCLLHFKNTLIQLLEPGIPSGLFLQVPFLAVLPVPPLLTRYRLRGGRYEYQGDNCYRYHASQRCRQSGREYV